MPAPGPTPSATTQKIASVRSGTARTPESTPVSARVPGSRGADPEPDRQAHAIGEQHRPRGHSDRLADRRQQGAQIVQRQIRRKEAGERAEQTVPGVHAGALRRGARRAPAARPEAPRRRALAAAARRHRPAGPPPSRSRRGKYWRARSGWCSEQSSRDAVILRQPAEQLQHLMRQAQIERGHRLVGEQQRRPPAPARGRWRRAAARRPTTCRHGRAACRRARRAPAPPAPRRARRPAARAGSARRARPTTAPALRP